MERIDRKLSSWKGKYLSMGGRITLLKVVLTSIPIYLLFGFRCPVSLVKRIEKIQQGFLWNDTLKERKYHLVSLGLGL